MIAKPTYREYELKISSLEHKLALSTKANIDSKQNHEERIRFETLLSKLFASFVNVPAHKIDDKAEQVLQQIGETLGFDRTDFVQLNKDNGELKITHSWTAKGVVSITGMTTNEGFPLLTQLITSKDEHILFKNPHDLPEKSPVDTDSFVKLGVTSGLMIPFFSRDQFVCAVCLGSHKPFTLKWSEELIQRLRLIGEVISSAMTHKENDLKIAKAHKEIEDLKEQLQQENILLHREIKSIQHQAEIIGESSDIQEVMRKIQQVAPTNSSVLITGETGTGKGMIANTIHNTSGRKHRAMITVNCSALPSTLVEGELFGREKGAYTGALTKQAGRFEIANGSTIFLDEIGELSLELQVKLLRVLEEGQFERLGSGKTITTDIRVIAATNQDLEKRIQEGRFRQDLFYRLNVFPIHISPLRQRQDDIIPLAWTFIKIFSETMGRRIDMISEDSLEAIQNYPWPGNVRELKNIVERGVIIGSSKILQVKLQSAINSEPHLNLEAHQREHILKVLKSTKWRIRGRNGAAEILGLKPTTLYSRMKKLGLKRP